MASSSANTPAVRFSRALKRIRSSTGMKSPSPTRVAAIAPSREDSIISPRADPSVANIAREMICRVSRLMWRATSIGASRSVWSQRSQNASVSSTMAGA